MFQGLYHLIIEKNLAGKELTDEKISDFKRLVTIQAGLICCIFLLSFFRYLGFPLHIELAETLFFIVLGFYVFYLWDMLRNYTTSRRLILLNFFFIMGVFVLGFVSVNPFFPMPLVFEYRVVLVVIQACLLAVEGTVIYFTLQEFFRKDLGMSIRLWGSACIYLMTGLAFGSAYEILCILQIQCLGVDLPLRTEGFMRRVEYSLMVLSGMESPYAQVAEMVSSMGTVEAVWGQVFIVLIVGRLLSR